MIDLNTILASVTADDLTNELCAAGSRTVRCNAKQRQALINQAIDAGFKSFSGYARSFVTYTRGCIPDTMRAESLTFYLDRGVVEVGVSELTALGMAA